MTDFGEYPAMVAALEDAKKKNPLREQRQSLHPVFADPSWAALPGQTRVLCRDFSDADWDELHARQQRDCEDRDPFAGERWTPFPDVTYEPRLGQRGRRVAVWGES